jgi:hypothetical protein
MKLDSNLKKITMEMISNLILSEEKNKSLLRVFYGGIMLLSKRDIDELKDYDGEK